MRKAFTLIELLVVIAIIAILAAILFPVFAQAKQAAKITSSISGLKQLALGLHMYSGDFEDTAVFEYGYGTDVDSDAYHNHNTWVGRIQPYVKNRSIFFDKTMSDPIGEDFADPFFPGYVYKWEWITNFSLNTDGYSRWFGGGGCKTVDWTDRANRSLTAIAEPSTRLALSPTRYANLSWSWMRFYSFDAAFPIIDRYANGWSWNQLVWDTRKQYGAKLIGGFSDGHAGKFGREKFVGTYVDNPNQDEATDQNSFCDAMDRKDLWKFWGKAWSGD